MRILIILNSQQEPPHPSSPFGFFAYDTLITAYDSVLDKTIPERTVKFDKYKHNLKPWITTELRMAIKERDKLHQKFKKCKRRSQREILENEYNVYRADLHKRIKMAKRNYEKEIFEKNKNDSKAIWKNINRIIGNNVNKTSVPDKINDENGITLTKLDDIASGFNRNYVNVGPNVTIVLKHSRLTPISRATVNQ